MPDDLPADVAALQQAMQAQQAQIAALTAKTDTSNAAIAAADAAIQALQSAPESNGTSLTTDQTTAIAQWEAVRDAYFSNEAASATGTVAAGGAPAATAGQPAATTAAPSGLVTGTAVDGMNMDPIAAAVAAGTALPAANPTAVGVVPTTLTVQAPDAGQTALTDPAALNTGMPLASSAPDDTALNPADAANTPPATPDRPAS